MRRRTPGRRDGRGGPEPASLVGVEQEYRVLLDGQPVDFRWVIGRLPLDGRRVDPGDPLALRCAWGGLVTADDGEAEIAIPPVSVEPGWAQTVIEHLRAGHDELQAALPPELLLEGFSTHLSIAMPESVNDRVCRDVTRRFAPALLLLTGHAGSPGVLVRPRPGRTELGLDHVDGDVLRAAATFAAGAARTSAAAAAGDRTAARLLPPSIRRHVEPAVRRYGFYLDRTAFGGDILQDGRGARLRRRLGGTVTGQDMLEAAWAAARHGLVGADAGDVALLDAMVMGRAPLPTEGTLPAAPDRPSSPPAASPFGEALRPYRSATVDVRAQFVTWDFVVFEARCGDRGAYVNIPRDGLEAFLGALHRGHVDPVIQDFVAAERGTPIVLSDHSQTREPGLYDGVGNPANLVPPERAPGGRGGTSVPGGRRSKQRSRRTERPQPAAAAAAVPKRSRKGLLVGALVAALIVAGGVVALAVSGGGDEPTAAGSHSPAVTSPAPATPSSGVVEPSPGESPAESPAATPSPSASPTETVAPPPTALSGAYGVVVTVADLGSPIEGVKVGDTSRGSWLLSTHCEARPCSLDLIGSTFFGSRVDATGPFLGRTVHGDADAELFCTDSTTGETLFTFTQERGDFKARVTNVRRVAGLPQATEFEGSFQFAWVPPPGQATPGCVRTTETDTFTGTIRESPPPKPLPPGAPTPPVAESAVIGTWDAAFHVVKARNVDDKSQGDDLTRVFSFIPKCRAATGCPLTLVRERTSGIGEQTLEPTSDGTYSETLRGQVDCGDGKATYVQTITLKVEDAEVVGGVWRATDMSGAYDFTQTAKPGVTGCKPVRELDRITATPQS